MFFRLKCLYKVQTEPIKLTDFTNKFINKFVKWFAENYKPFLSGVSTLSHMLNGPGALSLRRRSKPRIRKPLEKGLFPNPPQVR